MSEAAATDTPSPASEALGRVPDFFIVGHPKCGTTALFEMLRGHPQIEMPVKEPRFFASELHPGSTSSRLHPESFAEYTAMFAGAGPNQLVGEASPSYLRSHRAAARIAERQPDAKIVAILREPASFVRSLHMELVRDHVESEADLREALAREPQRRAADALRTAPGLVYSDYVDYVAQLRRYFDAFGPERVLVLIYDDFRADNEATVRRVLRFLGVHADAPIETRDANPTVRVRSLRAYELVRSLYMGRGRVARMLKGAVKALTPRRWRRDALGRLRRSVLYAAPEPPDEALMRELRARFRDEVVLLGEYLDRDLTTLWGYDRIG